MGIAGKQFVSKTWSEDIRHPKAPRDNIDRE